MEDRADDADAGWAPVRIGILVDATEVARALGLEIELPDVGSRDPAYWEAVRRDGWKPALRGSIADTEEERGDPDRCTLLAYPWGRVRFGLEEGVVVAATVAGLLPALDMVHGLGGRGVPLRDGDGSALVKAMQGRFSAGMPDTAAAFRAAGLVPEPGMPDTFWWEPDPARWPGA